MKTYNCDGGAFVEPPTYQFHNAYFSVVDENANLIQFQKDIGDFHSLKAEYEAIKWAVENIKERPIRLTSDCTVAIAWANKGGNLKNFGKIAPLNLEGITLEWEHGGLADQWNAANHSPKLSKGEYYLRWKKANPGIKKRKREIKQTAFSFYKANSSGGKIT